MARHISRLSWCVLALACRNPSNTPPIDEPGETALSDTSLTDPLETGLPPEDTAETHATDDTSTGDSGTAPCTPPATPTGSLRLSGTLELDAPAYHAKFEAALPNAWLGYAVQDAGDVNADGFADVLVHSGLASVGTDHGEVLLIQGPLAGIQNVSAAATRILDETPGVGYNYELGQGLARGADYDGLGVDDVVFSHPHYSNAVPEVGAVYLFSGPFGAPGTTMSAATYDARIVGEKEADRIGHDVDLAGDVNGDGQADLMISAFQGATWDEFIYVFYGPIGLGDHVISEADVQITNDTSGFNFGYYLEGLGDTNGDGLDDIVTMDNYAAWGGEDAGAAYLFLGPMVDGTTSSGADAIRWGEAEFDNVAYVAGPGDVNDDGYADVAIGAIGTDHNGSSSGSTYIVHGPVVGQDSLGTAAVRLDGLDVNDGADQVARAGDLDLDGIPDLLVGAPIASGVRSEGGIYVIYSTLADGTYTIDDVMGALIIGEDLGDEAYRGVGIGDFDGDCQPDVLIGARNNGAGGAAYIVQGGYGF